MMSLDDRRNVYELESLRDEFFCIGEAAGRMNSTEGGCHWVPQFVLIWPHLTNVTFAKKSGPASLRLSGRAKEESDRVGHTSRPRSRIMTRILIHDEQHLCSLYIGRSQIRGQSLSHFHDAGLGF